MVAAMVLLAPVLAVPDRAAGDAPGMAAMPMPPGAEVPHYFGPYANYANSPLRLADAIVELTGGAGNGAMATATVDPSTGAVTAIDVVDPGAGYTSAPAVTITSATVTPAQPATAVATVDSTGVVSEIVVDDGGAGYDAPVITLVGGGGTGAHAVANGSVDAVVVTDGGSGYSQQPVVEVSMPEQATGTRATASATVDANGTITGVEVVDGGSGYTAAPTVTIRDQDGAAGPTNPAVAHATLTVGGATLDDFGTSYDTAPTVTITDATGTGSGAIAHAAITRSGTGAVTAITVTDGGAGYVTPGIKKFVDTLPGLGAANANNLGQYIPVATPDTTTYPGSDYYEIAVVQYREKMHSDLPATLLRGYVQLETATNAGISGHVALENEMLDGTAEPIVRNGAPVYAVDEPHYLGPLVSATKDRPVRILFRNLLPTGVDGDLFLPVDTTVMGAGMGPAMNGMEEPDPQNPMCGAVPKPAGCFTENRATLHLHGGITPWISDGTPHQWITPADESTPYPKGVSVANVPDMPDPGPGAQTFFYTNQQSARMMFYHDHAWGITRLNVYAGEAAGYLITDPIEQRLIDDGIIPSDQVPLVVQDKTFVPSSAQLERQDPTWDAQRYGGHGNLWVPHVYMPAQNPGATSGANDYGRWAYGPWFWPPTNDVKHGPVPNPYYDPNCDTDVEEFCEPPLIPGVPNVSMGMEAFNDTPIVNGTAYPTTTVDPKAYRFRVLNAANDRFFNLSLFEADAASGGTEVALNESEVQAALTDTSVFPTPDTTRSPAGPDWVQIGTEGGFLPAPTVIPAQPITWVNDPTVFNAGNVDQHSLLIAPAERADVIVDFSEYAGKTLILYNDAPAAFPARDARYDYYAGSADLTDTGGVPTIPVGYGPNTRTVMQIKVADAAPAPAFDLTRLTNAFRSTTLGGLGVFETGQHPIIVGQGAYNSAYASTFRTNAPRDGYARIQDTSLSFNTLLKQGTETVTMPMRPKAIQDEMGEAYERDYGRMSGNLGVERPNPSATTQNLILYPYINPATEVIDGVQLPVGQMDASPIATADDGTQIWKVTHNGVDTHPIHFHLYDVQLVNRVGWDGIIRRPDPNELGWKDTVRISPLEDTIIALRPIIPKVPFGVPDSIRPLDPMMPIGSTLGFNNTDTNGNPISPPIVNRLVNFGWEYVWHCHILSHEEMDMMRPISVAVDRALADEPQLAYTDADGIHLTWTDGTAVTTDPRTWGDPKAEVGFRIERAPVTNGDVGAFEPVGVALANATTHTDQTPGGAVAYAYRVVAWNAAGESVSNTVQVGVQGANPPTSLDATLVGGPQARLTWIDNAGDEDGFVVQRAVAGGPFTTLETTGPHAGTGSVTFVDATISPATTYEYRVAATNAAGLSAFSGVASLAVPAIPAVPANLDAVLRTGLLVDVTWEGSTGAETYVVERSVDGGSFGVVSTVPATAGAGGAYTGIVVPGHRYAYRVLAANIVGTSMPSDPVTVVVPTVPAAPTSAAATLQTGPQVSVRWRDNATNETGFAIERSTNGGAYEVIGTGAPRGGSGMFVRYVDTTVAAGNTYRYRVTATNISGTSGTSNAVTVTVPTIPAAPTALSASTKGYGTSRALITLRWRDNAGNESGFTVERSADPGFTTVTTTTLERNDRVWSVAVPRGTRWYFRVRAFNLGGPSAWAGPIRVDAPQ
jgi:FtsP/CotA-like multicopper oxidase with cupredoxin domain